MSTDLIYLSIILRKQTDSFLGQMRSGGAGQVLFVDFSLLFFLLFSFLLQPDNTSLGGHYGNWEGKSEPTNRGLF
jgi:hypothetical protein